MISLSTMLIFYDFFEVGNHEFTLRDAIVLRKDSVGVIKSSGTSQDSEMVPTQCPEMFQEASQKQSKKQASKINGVFLFGNHHRKKGVA